MKSFLLIMLCFLLVQFASAQDTITRINGKELKVKVLEITSQKVVYQATDSVTGKHYSLPKFEVFMIRFANGTKEVFQEHLQFAGEGSESAQDPEKMYLLGQLHAKAYNKRDYQRLLRSEKAAGTSQTYLKDHNYLRGYEEESSRRNFSKSAIGLGLIGGSILFVVVVSSLL